MLGGAIRALLERRRTGIDLATVAQPIVERVAKATGETASLDRLSNNEIERVCSDLLHIADEMRGCWHALAAISAPNEATTERTLIEPTFALLGWQFLPQHRDSPPGLATD